MKRSELIKRSRDVMLATFEYQLREGTDMLSVIKDKSYKRSQSSYPFIPHSTRMSMEQLIHAFDYLSANRKTPNFTFLDAGCGIGNIMSLARGAGFMVYGLEIDPKAIKVAKIMNPSFSKRIKRGDILTHRSYGKYDVVYYYCPFYSVNGQQKFEERVENQMKIGAILIANMKQSAKIHKDKRFHLHEIKVIRHDISIRFFEKISE